MRCYFPDTLLNLGSDTNLQESKELYAMDALPELLKTLKRASCMTVDQVASGKSALARQVAKMRKGAQLPKQELNSSLSL